MNKHLGFINKLFDLGFYAYRVYKGSPINCYTKQEVYKIAMLHKTLSPVIYEIPINEITSEDINSISIGEPKRGTE